MELYSPEDYTNHHGRRRSVPEDQKKDINVSYFLTKYFKTAHHSSEPE